MDRNMSAYGSYYVSIWIEICQHMDLIMSAYGSKYVSIWILLCQHMDRNMSAYGSNYVSIWIEICQHMDLISLRIQRMNTVANWLRAYIFKGFLRTQLWA